MVLGNLYVLLEKLVHHFVKLYPVFFLAESVSLLLLDQFYVGFAELVHLVDQGFCLFYFHPGIPFAMDNHQRRLQLVEAVRDLLACDGRTMVQGAIAWIWARSPVTIPIPGARNPEQIAENAGAMRFGALVQTQMDEIEAIVRGSDGS